MDEAKKNLIDLCAALEPMFQNFQKTAAVLTPYATVFRYPGEFFEAEPDKQQVETAIKLAKEVAEFVMNQLPAEVWPI